MSTIQKITDFELKWDYTEVLLKEISEDIEILSKFPKNIKDNLKKINAKIDLAKSKGLFTKKIEEQVINFRETIFIRNINNRIEELASNPNMNLVNILDFENEYIYLKDKVWNTIKIDESIEYLRAVVFRSYIYIMIIDIKESWWVSNFSIDWIIEKMQEAKEKWINVEDLENLLFE